MNKNEFQNGSYQEDEIDLRELFKILVRYKYFIVIFTLVVTFGAIFYALSKTPIYEVKSNVQVGYIGEDLIVAPETLVKTLNLVFNVEDKPSSKDEFVSEVTSISTNKNLKNFIEIKTEAISNEEALKKNREVVDFIKNLYQPKIEQYLTEAKNSIENTKRIIKNIDEFDIKNINEQIRILKEQALIKIDEEIKRLKEQDIKKLQQQIHLLKSQKIVKIDEDIKRLKEQDIKKLQQQIQLLKTQKISKINEEIRFLKDFKLKTIEAKIDFHTKKLEEYTQSVNKLYSDIRNTQEAAASTIASIQMVNYQNLILNSQNKIEDLKVEKEIILTQTIPNLEREKENIINVSIRDLELQIENINNIKIANLQREKENITNVSIRDLELQIENINNIKIAELQREKENISNEQIRKLQYQIDVELVSKKIKLNEQIDRLNYSITKQNIRNNEVVGDFIVKDYP
ncbi:MAG: Wzz/FepE/Etk N-terminal domain-containing protein, partial [Sulfurimonas sp.]|uniref:Wzz/FepE/Etk N-terminal domain-containing protein n=1 Tax=Sulfurimonas sp. TaxID=2022749 RepID=UPI0028CEAFD6